MCERLRERGGNLQLENAAVMVMMMQSELFRVSGRSADAARLGKCSEAAAEPSFDRTIDFP